MSRKWRPENLCRHCACNPCQCHTHEQLWAKGKEAHDERTKSRPEPKAPKAKKVKKKPSKSKSAFIRDLRKKNPSISDAQIKTALRKAGYSVGCLGVAILILSTPVGGLAWGAYEIVRAVTG